MSGLFISFFSILLLLLSLFLVLIILIQRASTQAGLGTAFGGGFTESAFGAQAGNVLTRSTILACSIFFILSFGLYLAYLNAAGPSDDDLVLPDTQQWMSEALSEAPANTPLPIETAPVNETGVLPGEGEAFGEPESK